MKFNCGPTQNERIEAKVQWHNWFAWFPVRIEANKCAWLEIVLRKGKFTFTNWDGFSWEFEYRLKEGSKADSTIT